MPRVSLRLFFAIFAAVEGATWDYNENGPSTWPEHYPNCCGSSQSPINIVTSAVQTNSSLGLFDRQLFYPLPTKMTLRNTGHSLQMDINAGGYTIENSTILPFPAKITQFHFHWANTSSTGGSEHTVDGKRYYGELHIVHFNTKYTTFDEAFDKSDGLAVFGFFIEADYPQDNEYFNSILDLLTHIEKSGETQNIVDRFSVETLLPHDLSYFYRYQGSLTTPGCDESVVWTVFRDPIRISAAQATKLSTSLYDSVDTSGNIIANNFRPVQQLKCRTVSAPTPLTQPSSASVVATSPTILITLVFGLLGAHIKYLGN